MVSNISNFKLLENVKNISNFKIIANYTFNVFNKYTIEELKELGATRFAISPESNKNIIINICESALSPELIVYGNTPLMNMNYCVNGKSNKCYPNCNSNCNSNNKYYLKDRMNMEFRVLFDNIQTVSTIYNSKISSIIANDFDVNHCRVDILDESIDDINFIIEQISAGKRLEGKAYTNGNLNKEL